MVILSRVQRGEQAAAVEDQRQPLLTGFGRTVEFFLEAFSECWIFTF